MREGKGHFHSLTKDLLDTDHPSSRNWIRMDMDKFPTIVDMLQAYPNLEKQSTVMWEATSIPERLAITLRFLATGKPMRLAYLSS